MYAIAVLTALAMAQPVPDAASLEQGCRALTALQGRQLGADSARIVTAKFNAPAGPQPPPLGAPPWIRGLPALPEHCELIGLMRERTGSDGQKYAVRFHMRLPSDWNGRFLFQGGGGTGGELGDATGPLQPGMPVGIGRGFAVISTDTGHDNAVNVDPTRQGNVAFAHDYEGRLEHAEKALDSVATAGKAIVAAYYGRKPAYNYFAGCSNGGREGMVFAQRFPAQFDGIVAVAPAFAVPKAALAEANDVQAFAVVARQMGVESDGVPDLARAFSDRDLALVAEAIVKSCDALDGLADGMVQDLQGCTTRRVEPELRRRICRAGQNTDCLADAKVTALLRSMSGPHNSQGAALYSDWPWDPGMANMGWRVWKFGIPGQLPAINVVLGSPALSGLFMTPPRDVPATPAANLQFQLAFNFDRDAPQIFATAPGFARSSWDLIGAQATDLTPFAARGGKLIVPHGGADPIFSVNDSIRWWERVNRRAAGQAAKFVRVFAVPGMNHCTGGPATDQFDALASLMDWVEAGKAPDTILAKAGPAAPFPGRARPLCPYPLVARYRGGNAEDAASFACERPRH
jgi:pimeloyl-ACP methyl ester carboxylesterase